ncbi:MAG TPA: hypothetical protein VHZ54_03795 [Solirubrobacterales bacterium]|nr:hypothetical protein [Solirubrobacterales bacterium]
MKITAIRPPRGVLPGVVPAEMVLARSEAATVSLGRLWVYPTGFELRMSVDWDEASELDPFQHVLMRRGRDVPADSPERLVLGFAFADGSETSNRERGRRPSVDRDSPTPTLTGMGTGAGGGHGSASFWLWPLPPPGSVEVFCEWRAAGIAPTRRALDAEAIAAAAGRAQKVFEDDDGQGRPGRA